MSMTREEAIDIIENKIQIDVRLCTKEEVEQYIEALTMACSALRPVSREQVEKVWRGEWKHEKIGKFNHLDQYTCSKCGFELPWNPLYLPIWCEKCGAPMTDEAVDMMLERWKEAVSNEA